MTRITKTKTINGIEYEIRTCREETKCRICYKPMTMCISIRDEEEELEKKYHLLCYLNQVNRAIEFTRQVKSFIKSNKQELMLEKLKGEGQQDGK